MVKGLSRGLSYFVLVILFSELFKIDGIVGTNRRQLKIDIHNIREPKMSVSTE